MNTGTSVPTASQRSSFWGGGRQVGNFFLHFSVKKDGGDAITIKKVYLLFLSNGIVCSKIFSFYNIGVFTYKYTCENIWNYIIWLFYIIFTNLYPTKKYIFHQNFMVKPQGLGGGKRASPLTPHALAAPGGSAIQFKWQSHLNLKDKKLFEFFILPLTLTNHKVIRYPPMLLKSNC